MTSSLGYSSLDSTNSILGNSGKNYTARYRRLRGGRRRRFRGGNEPMHSATSLNFSSIKSRRRRRRGGSRKHRR